MLKPGDYRKAQGYKELEYALGATVAAKLVAHTVKTLSVRSLGDLDLLLKLECSKLARLSAHFCRLNSCYPSVSSTPLSEEDAVQEAAHWIYQASLSRAISETTLKNTLLDFLHSGFVLLSFGDAEKLHRSVALGISSYPRGIVATDSPLPSSFAGQVLFDLQLRKNSIAVNSPLYPQFLFGWITGWHPFADGNGRTARAAYAIAAIRNGCWRPLSKPEEDKLSGL